MRRIGRPRHRSRGFLPEWPDDLSVTEAIAALAPDLTPFSADAAGAGRVTPGFQRHLRMILDGAADGLRPDEEDCRVCARLGGRCEECAPAIWRKQQLEQASNSIGRAASDGDALGQFMDVLMDIACIDPASRAAIVRAASGAKFTPFSIPGKAAA